MKIIRHNNAIRFTHWVTALSIFVLLFTGIGQMPVYKRYNVDKIAGLQWSSDYLITLNIHYIAALILVFISIFYLTYLIMTKRFDILPKKGDMKESMLIFASMVGLAKEPENRKFLAEQRLAFAVTAFSVLIMIVTGIIKVYKNLSGAFLSETWVFWAAQMHNLFTFILLFSIIMHLVAFLIKDNRPLVPSMFTGKIRLDYVARRHKLWLEELSKNASFITTESLPIDAEEAEILEIEELIEIEEPDIVEMQPAQTQIEIEN